MCRIKYMVYFPWSSIYIKKVISETPLFTESISPICQNYRATGNHIGSGMAVIVTNRLCGLKKQQAQNNKRHAPGVVTKLSQIPSLALSKHHIKDLLLKQHPLE